MEVGHTCISERSISTLDWMAIGHPGFQKNGISRTAGVGMGHVRISKKINCQICLGGPRALPPRALVRRRRLLLHLSLVRDPRPLGRIPFPFLPSPLASFLHLLLISLLSSRLFLFLPVPSCSFLFLPPSSHPCLHFLRHLTLCFLIFVKSHSATCQVPSYLTSPVTKCLCVRLSSLYPPPSLLFPCATGESTCDPRVFVIIIIIFTYWWLSYKTHSLCHIKSILSVI